MSARGPLLTLGAVVVLTALLLVVNTLIGPTPAPSRSGAPVPAATNAPGPSASPTSPASATPSATSTPAAVQAVFAGTTSGGEATLAIAVNGGSAAAYLCDGNSLEAWYQGTVTGDQVSLAGPAGATLTGTISGSALFGSASTPTGQAFPFSAAQATPPAGVYQARLTINGLATRIGWAVLPDGTQVGVAKVGDQERPAPAFDPGTGSFTLDGTPGTAEPVDGSDTGVGG
jgi:hypothetical protein